MFKKKPIKGQRTYGIVNPDNSYPYAIICTDIDIEKVKRSMDYNYTILVELTVTRVFTRERELVEIETEL